MPLDPSIYNQVGQVNLGQGLSSILDQQRQRDAAAEQRQLTLASLSQQQEAAKQAQSQKRNQELNMWLSGAVQSGRPIEEVLPEAIEKGKQIGVMPDVTQRHVTSVYGAGVTPEIRAASAAGAAYPERFAALQMERAYPKQPPVVTPPETITLLKSAGIEPSSPEGQAIIRQKLNPEKPLSAPTMRTYESGDKKITEEWDPRQGKWKRVAEGSAKADKLPTDWKYDPGSDEWVAPPTAEAPQGKRTGSISKLNAVTAAKDLISEFRGTETKPGLIRTTPTGGIMGISGQIAKVTDSQKVREFDNLKESISTQLRTVFRIPGEGALSDKEQAQYGLQLPDIRNDDDVNERILQRIERSLETRVSPTVVTPQQPSVKPTQQDAEAIAWARANPNDPRSARILSLHGK